MPFPVVSPILFNAQAMFAADASDHLQPGIHLRVSPHPGLGLPVAPFVVWRANSAGVGAPRGTEFIFVDDDLRVLVPPFQLQRGKSVLAYPVLEPDQACIWAKIEAEAANPAAGRITVEALQPMGFGLAPVCRRLGAPYAVSAPGIVAVRISGQGSVTGATWIADRGRNTLDLNQFAVLNLPHAGGPRYISVENPVARCEALVLSQAPMRRPLHETLGLTPPSAAPAANAAYELLRVNALAAGLAADLDALITDLSADPHVQAVTAPALDASGRQIGTMTQRRLDRVMQLRHDPGTATLFGHKARDTRYDDTSASKMFYWISGFFRSTVPAAGMPGHDPALTALLDALGKENRFRTKRAMVKALREATQFIQGFEFDRASREALEERDDYIVLGALAVADLTAPPAPPPPPEIVSATDLGWLPRLPPEAVRQVRLDLAGGVTGGLLAAESLATGSLNSAGPVGLHLPVVLGQLTTQSAIAPAPVPGSGSILDKAVGPDAVEYGVAQQDAFGQWSGWRRVTVPAGQRPPPPQPVLIATYMPPRDPATEGGRIEARVNVPPLASLAPGAHPLAELHVTITDEALGTSETHDVALARPLEPRPVLPLTVAGPLLAPCERRTLRVSAVWEDRAGALSVPSLDTILTLTDPRPPAQLPPPPDVLAYSSRPDATGRSWVEEEWDATPDQAGFAVYYSDENRLRAHLAHDPPDPSDRALLDEIDDAPDAAARATLYRSNAERFPGFLFERLSGAVVAPSAGRAAFRHSVSGSLRVLSVYRIAAESASNARPVIDTLPFHIYAVPNLDPPPKPVVEVRPAEVADGTLAATVTIRTRGARTQAETWRLRRSNLGARDLLRMPVVGTGAMTAVDDATAVGEVTDAGPVEIAPDARLAPWVRYTWVAEVQGAPAPGSVAAGRPVPGRWSLPSEPASLVLIPPDAPAAPRRVGILGRRLGDVFNGVQLRVETEKPLSGGSFGTYRLRAFRQVPDGPIEALDELEVSGAGPFLLSGATGPLPLGTRFTVAVLDPLGREGPPAQALLGRGG